MRLCALCRFPADLPKPRPRFCVIHFQKIPTLQPAIIEGNLPSSPQARRQLRPLERLRVGEN